jgi:alpha-tubulin suppressor-like RCC1 family protein
MNMMNNRYFTPSEHLKFANQHISPSFTFFVSSNSGMVSPAGSIYLTLMFSTSKDELFAVGNNYMGLLATGDVIHRERPTKIETLSCKKVSFLVIRYDNAAAITANDELYVWGDTSCGQNGDGIVRDNMVTKLQLNPKGKS